MHTLFHLDLNLQSPALHSPEWPFVRRVLQAGLNQFIRYYQDNVTTVKSNHILVKLLQSIPVSKSLELQHYYDAVDAIAGDLSMAMKFTSSINKGNIFNSVFYGNNSNEVLISIDVPFDSKYAHDHWKDVSAVRVLRHDRSSLALNPLRGEDKYKEEIAVVSINIPLLAIQYRAFRINENLISPDDSQKSVMQFIAMYVLPNMMTSHLDYVIFNRAYNLLTDQANSLFINKTPFYQTNYELKVDRMLNEVIDKFSTTKARFDTILKSFQVITKESLFDVMQLPKVAPTRQVLWALVISRIRALKFLFLFNAKVGSNENQANMNRVLRQALFYQSDNTLQYGLTPELYLEVKNTIDELTQLAQIR